MGKIIDRSATLGWQTNLLYQQAEEQALTSDGIGVSNSISEPTVESLNNGTMVFWTDTGTRELKYKIKLPDGSYTGGTLPLTSLPNVTLTYATDWNSSIWLAWTGNGDSYQVKYGTQSRNYTNVIDVGQVTEYQIPDSILTIGQTYYIAITASNLGGQATSNEWRAVAGSTILTNVLTKSFETDTIGQPPTPVSGEMYNNLNPNTTAIVTNEQAPVGLTKSLKISATNGIFAFNISTIDWSTWAEQEFYFYVTPVGQQPFIDERLLISIGNLASPETLSIRGNTVFSDVIAEQWHKIKYSYNPDILQKIIITLDGQTRVVPLVEQYLTPNWICHIKFNRPVASPTFAVYIANIKYSITP